MILKSRVAEGEWEERERNREGNERKKQKKRERLRLQVQTHKLLCGYVHNLNWLGIFLLIILSIFYTFFFLLVNPLFPDRLDRNTHFCPTLFYFSLALKGCQPLQLRSQNKKPGEIHHCSSSSVRTAIAISSVWVRALSLIIDYVYFCVIRPTLKK